MIFLKRILHKLFDFLDNVTEEKCNMIRDELWAFYSEILNEFEPYKVGKNRHVKDDFKTIFEQLSYLLEKIEGGKNLPSTSDEERIWGFIQGVFWATGVFTLDELRAHLKNKFDDEPYPIKLEDFEE